MPTWKKVIVSGSTAALGNLTITNGLTVTGSLNAPSITGSLQGTSSWSNNALTASYVTGSIYTSTNLALSASYAITSSYITSSFFTGTNAALSASYATTASYLVGGTATPGALSYGVGLTGSATSFNGASPVTFTINTGSSNLNSNTILKWNGTGFANSSLYDNGTLVTGSVSVQLSGANSSLSGSFSGSHYGALTGTASYASTAGQTQYTLTLGNGLTGTSFNGTAPVTAAVGAGALITVGAGLTSVSTSSLSTNQLPKYTGNTLSGSNVSDTGTQVQITAGATSGLKVFAGGIAVTGNSTFDNNVTVAGDFTVAGTASFQNTQNLLIADKFILLNSGSTSLSDGGIIIAAAGLSGSAFYLESGVGGDHGSYGRFAIQYNVTASNPSVSADEYMISAKINQALAPVDSTPPTWGVSGNGGGNMWVTSTGDIYIWS